MTLQKTTTGIKPAILGGPGTLEDNAQALARALYRGDINESQIREIPPQSLYFALKHLGLDSSPEVLDSVSQVQYQALLDFEFWTKDSFREDRLWGWLSAVDDPTNLVPMQRFLQIIDPDILALIAKRYIEVVYHEEKDDPPPGPSFYSPDKGATWISFKTHDPERHRLLGKIFAFLFQTNQDIYYQLLLHAHSATSVEFEEQAYRERSRRLSNQFIPHMEEASTFNSSLGIDRVKELMLQVSKADNAIDHAGNYPVIPLFNRGVSFQPLISILEQISDERLYIVQSELSKILNGAIVFFVGDFAEEISLKLTSEQVFGAINIAFQLLLENEPEMNMGKIMEEFPLTPIYQLGLGELYRLRKTAQRVPEDVLSTLRHMNEAISIIIETLRRPFPGLPAFYREDGTFEISENKMSVEQKAISSLLELRLVEEMLEKQVYQKFAEIRSYEKQSQKHSAIKDGVTKNMQ
ncbi:MAG TPA: DUF6178 family protein [Oligoflexia bacterium]|nr:DUF6178 family protein [Oligoflexia bacterium]HMP47471.1 DUF6178 family protein [Oligoflexia bacterium]